MLLALFNWFTGYYKARSKVNTFRAGFTGVLMSPTYSILIGCV